MPSSKNSPIAEITMKSAIQVCSIRPAAGARKNVKQ